MDRLTELRQRFPQEPLAAFLGMRLDDIGDGTATVSMTVKDEHTIVGGIAQGGVTTTLADFAGVYAAMARIPTGHTPAKHIMIELLRPVRLGDVIAASATIIAETRSTVVVAVDVLDQDGKQKAYATIAFAKPKRP